MTTSTLPAPCAPAGSGKGWGIGIPNVVSTSPARSMVRLAGLEDVPAIARITGEGPQPPGIEPSAMVRATRLLLTHVAFEHGALWVEQMGDEPIMRGAAAIPVGQLVAPHSKLRDVIRRFAGAVIPAPAPVFGVGEALLAELKSVGPSWLLVEISKASQNPIGDPALLGAALQWAREHSEPARAPVLVVTDTMPERRAAESLGFVERRTWGQHWPWWLGVAAPVVPNLNA